MLRCPIPAVRISPDELDQLGVAAAAGDAAAEARAISGVAALAWGIVSDALRDPRLREAILDDVFADVLVDVVKAVRTFRIGHNARLSTYAGRCAERATWKRRRMHLARLRRGSGDEHDSAGRDERAGHERLDLRARSALLWRVTEMAVALPELEREVLRRRFGLFGSPPETLVAIGASMKPKLSSERIRQIEGDALYRLGARSAPVIDRGR